MQINPISNSYNTGFNGTGRVYLNNGSTVLAEVMHNKKGKITDLSLKILKKGKEQDIFTHQWKRGISYDRFLQSYWIENICKKLKLANESDQDKISDVIFDAEINEIVTKNNGDQENESFDECLEDIYPEDAYPEDAYFEDPDYGYDF
jgi:hypothetical protein